MNYSDPAQVKQLENSNTITWLLLNLNSIAAHHPESSQGCSELSEFAVDGAALTTGPTIPLARRLFLVASVRRISA